MKWFDAPVVKAILALSLVNAIFIYYAASEKPEIYPVTILVLTILAEQLLMVLAVCLLKAVRAEHPTVGVFGYVWRALVLRFSALFLIAIFLALVLTTKAKLPSFTFTASTYVASLFALPALAWLLFSKSRRNQFMWARHMFTGQAYFKGE